MNVLLLSPPSSKPAPAPGEQQLECLSVAVERILESGALDCRRETLIADDNQCSASGRDGLVRTAADLVVVVHDADSAGTAKLQTLAQLYQCPVVQISLRFPAALIRTDITLSVCTASGHRLEISEPADLDSMTVMPEAYYFSQFAPSTYSKSSADCKRSPIKSTAIPDSPQSHSEPEERTDLETLVMLDRPTSDPDYNPQHDLATVLAMLDRVDTIGSITLAQDSLTSSANPERTTGKLPLEEMANSIRQHCRVPVTIQSPSRLPEELLPFLRRFNIALFGGSNLYADAIELGIPVYAWRQNESTTLLNELLEAALPMAISTIGRTQRTHISDQQKELLSETINRSQTLTVVNRHDQLKIALMHLVSILLPSHPMTKTDPASSPLDNGTVIAPQPMDYPTDDRLRTRRRLRQVQRKLLKFRQSPTRFIRDSNTPLARSLNQWLPPAKS